MIITAILLDKTIQMPIATGLLVYDGEKFVDPLKAKTVMLVQTTGVPVVGNSYEIHGSSPIPAGLTIYNRYVCTVTSVADGSVTSEFQPVTSVDPTGGVCVCGITCNLTEVQAVRVTVQ